MLTKNFIKSSSYILALSILSIGGAILIHSVLAFTGPSADPPASNLTSSDTLQAVTTRGASTDQNLTLTSSNLYLYQTANAKAYLDSYEGVQIRIDSDANDTSEFSINNGDNVEIFKIDESGNITAKSDYLPTSDKHLATKDYVDAASDSGDATLAKQEEILTAVGSIGGDASYAKQLEIQSDLQRSMGWILPSQTYYSVGGNTYFCRSNQVSADGIATISNIHDGSTCDTSKQCDSGSCVSVVLLSYSGATHTDLQCDQAGGTIYNTGNGNVCKFSGTNLSCPAGWTQADNWQKYTGDWGSYTAGDECGNWADISPLSFSNQVAIDYERIGGIIEGRCTGGCATDAGWQETTPYTCDNGRTYVWNFWDMNITTNPTTNRTEIGCK